MFDTHLHTMPFSTDSHMSITELLEKQKETSNGLILTEHIDYDFPPPNVYDFSPKEYFKTYGHLRNNNFLLGVEVGLQPSIINKNINLVKSYPFDMVIGSIHAVNGYDLYCTTYHKQFHSKKEAYLEYLKFMLDNIKSFKDFDTLAHIDYICRKAPYEDNELYYSDFPEIIDEILLTLINNNKVIEINTRRFHNKKSIDSLTKIYKRYKTLGGKYVTLGSDAHYANVVSNHFDTAIEMANECDLIPVYFKERKMEII